jgi:Coenzyme PQQ synthesis protein D (PqqD)
MDFLQTFQINAPTVVSEIFDDEVVIINMENGSYYSLDQSGMAIWQQLQQGATVAELSAKVATIYALVPSVVTPAIEQFMAQLAQEQLIVPVTRSLESQTTHAANAKVLFKHTHQGQFTAPALNKFTDMQDLLLLDPIHDVAETGWPHVNSN